MAISKPKPPNFYFYFGLVPKSPTHTGLDYIKTLEPNIPCLGSFKGKLTNTLVSVLLNNLWGIVF
jgi:hypothetical protein